MGRLPFLRRAFIAGTAAVLAAAASQAADLSKSELEVLSNDWSLAQQIIDLGDVPSDAASPFRRAGWERVATTLGKQSAAALADLKSGALRPDVLLAGDDRDAYCMQLNGLSTASIGAKLDVPLELIWARAVTAAIAPYMKDIASSISRSSDPDIAQEEILRAVRLVLSDDRLADVLDLVGDKLASGRLTVTAPSDWPLGEPWPPTSNRIAKLAADLHHADPQTLLICKTTTPPPAESPVPTLEQIAASRVLVKAISKQVGNWAAERVKQAVAAQVTEAAAPALAVLPPVVAHEIPPAISAGEAVPNDAAKLVLVPFAGEPRKYYMAVRARIAAIGQEWPLGITVDDVTQAEGRLTYVVDPMLPRIHLDKKILQTTLEQLGLPDIVQIDAVGFDENPTPEHPLDNVSFTITYSIGAVFTSGSYQIHLIQSGKATSLPAQIGNIRTNAVATVQSALASKLPAFKYAGQDASLTVSSQNIDLVAGSSIIDGKLKFVPPSWIATDGQTAEVAVAVKVRVPLRSPGNARIIDVQWPAGLSERLGQKLAAFLPSDVIGTSACIGFTGLSLTQDGNGGLILAALVNEDGDPAAPVVIDGGLSTNQFVGQLTQRLSSPALQRCIAREIVNLTDRDVADALKALEGTKLSIIGQQFVLQDIKWSGGSGPATKGLFKGNLVSLSDPGLSLQGVTVDGTWRAGQPLPITSLGIDGVTIPAGFANKLVSGVNPVIATWITVRSVAFAKGRLLLDATLAVPGLPPVDMKGVTLDLSTGREALNNLIQQAAFAAIENGASAFEAQLASLGDIDSLELDKEHSHLDPLDLVFRVKVKVADGVVLPFLVHLPKFAVAIDGDLKPTMIAGALGSLSQALGGMSIGGQGVTGLRPVIDTVQNRYGVSFDSSVNIASAIEVKLTGIVLDKHGLGLPDSFSVGIPGYYPIPPYLAVSKLGGTVWVHPPGRFGVLATVTLSFDPSGAIVQLVTNLDGGGPSPKIDVDGRLLIVSLPLFEVQGTADFSQSVLSMTAKTLPPVSAILAMRTQSKIDAQNGVITASSNLGMLGLEAVGALEMHLRGDKLVMLTGSADWKTLGTKASLELQTTTEFHHPSAKGSVELHIIDTGSSFQIDPGRVDMTFSVFGASLEIIAPTVARIDSSVIEAAVRSLFDFHFSLEQLKHMRIVVNLMDRNGKPSSDPAGGGDPPGGEPGGPPADQGPPTPHQASGPGAANGTITSIEAAVDRCSSGKPADGMTRVWAKEPQLKGDSIEGDQTADKTKIFFSDDARIVSDSSKEMLNNSTIVDCYMPPQLSMNRFHFAFTNGDTSDIASPQVAVVVPHAKPDRLLVLVFQKGAQPIEISLPNGAVDSIFGAGGLQGVASWKGSRFSRSLLRRIVNSELDTARAVVIESMTVIPPKAMIDGWPARSVSLIRERKGGAEYAELVAEGDGVEIEKGSPLFALLSGDPSSPLTQLAASVSPLRRLTDVPPALTVKAAAADCQIVLAQAPKSTYYAVALAKNQANVIHMADDTSWRQASENWLTSLCPEMLAMGTKTEIRIAQASSTASISSTDKPVEKTVIAARSEVGAEIIWWLASATRQMPDANTGSKPPPLVTSGLCLDQGTLESTLTGPNIVRAPGAPDFKSTRAVDQLLIGLTGETDNWSPNFFVNPRGLFFSATPVGSNKCPTK